MKVVFLTGSHPRHAHLARALGEAGVLAGLVIEQRESFIPTPPAEIPDSTRELFVRHFAGRDTAEARFFGDARLPSVPTTPVQVDTLNARPTIEFINALAPDLVLSYGVHKLTADTLESIEAPLKWNIHGGLSPWYRGVTTHFWPSYHLEPQMTGMTVHELTSDIDGGNIVHQSVADLVRGDGVHETACRAVLSLATEIRELMQVVAKGALRGPFKQTTTGRIWRSADWRPAHLHTVYELYKNRIVDLYLDGHLQGTPAKLVRQF